MKFRRLRFRRHRLRRSSYPWWGWCITRAWSPCPAWRGWPTRSMPRAECFPKQARPASTSPRHWFIRVAVVLAALSPLLPLLFLCRPLGLLNGLPRARPGPRRFLLHRGLEPGCGIGGLRSTDASLRCVAPTAAGLLLIRHAVPQRHERAGVEDRGVGARHLTDEQRDEGADRADGALDVAQVGPGARNAGLGVNEIALAREFDSGDEREAALLRYVRGLLAGDGPPPRHLHEEAREAGWEDEQILEAVSHVALHSFANLVTRAGDVPADGSVEEGRAVRAA